MFSNAGIRLLSTRREPDRTGQGAIVRSTASLFAVVTSWSKKIRLRSCSPRGISALMVSPWTRCAQLVSFAMETVLLIAVPRIEMVGGQLDGISADSRLDDGS